MERRLIKDFQIGIVEGILHEALSAEKDNADIFTKIARVVRRRGSKSSKKRDWNAFVRKTSIPKNPIGSTEERLTRQSLRKYIIDKTKTLGSFDHEKLILYNPKLSEVPPAVRVAYAKFNINKIKQEFAENEKLFRKGNLGSDSFDSENPSSESSCGEKISMGKNILGTDLFTEESHTKKNPKLIETNVNLPKEEVSTPSFPLELSNASNEQQQKEGRTTSTPKDSLKNSEGDGKTNAEKVSEPKEALPAKSLQENESQKKIPKSLGPKKPGGKSQLTGEVLSGWL